MNSDETYLGDGLYARFDGLQIVLRAPRPEGDHYVALEPEVYEELRRFARKAWCEEQRLSTEVAAALLESKPMLEYGRDE